MKRFLAHLFCGVLLFTLAMTIEANAQNSADSPAVQRHIALKRGVNAFMARHRVRDTDESTPLTPPSP